MTFQVGDRVMVVNNDASEWGEYGDVGTVVSVTPPASLSRDYDLAVEFDAYPIGGHSLGGRIQNSNGLWMYASQLLRIGSGVRATSFAEFIRKQEQIRSAL